MTTVAAEAVEELAAVIGRSRSTQIGRAVRTILAAGRAVTPADYEAAQRLRAVWRADVDRLLTQADAILTPTIARPALRWSDPDLHDWRIARFLPLFNLTGHPAMSLPVPTDSLPIGAQLVGRRDQDVVLLGLARWVESQPPVSAPREAGIAATLTPVTPVGVAAPCSVAGSSARVSGSPHGWSTGSCRIRRSAHQRVP